MRVLVVEDEPVLRAGLTDLLGGAGHDVTAVADGATAAARGTSEVFDLVLLDVMLPKLDGVEVCKRLRAVHPSLPIIMLTARGAEDDKVRGLSVGADDYVTKPFGARELLARMDALLRRAKGAPPAADTVSQDGWVFDLGRCTATRDGKEQSLTAKEAQIIRFLFQNRNRAVTRAELLEHVWGVSPNMETRTVDVTVANLRQKIERDVAHPRVVVSVKGVGYAWGKP